MTNAEIVVIVAMVVGLIGAGLQVWWAVRVLRALERTAEATREGREYTRQLGAEVVAIKRQLLS